MIAFLIHAFVASGVAFLLSALYGALTPTTAVISLLIGLWVGRSRAKVIARSFPDLRFTQFAKGESGAIEVMLTIFVLYASIRHFVWLFFEIDAKWMTLHAHNYGDLPLHINYIRQIANGLAFPPVNPEFSSELLRYPFGADLYNALWESVGVPISSHLFLTGLFATVAVVTVLRWFGGWWALGAFFLSGGLAGWQILRGEPMPPDLLQNIDWKNLFLAVYITQRGVMFALPAGLLLIEATRRIYADELKPSKGLLTALGLIWGLLPLFHAHAFVIVSIIMALIAIACRRSFKALKDLLLSRMALVAYLPAIYFTLRTSDGLKKTSVIHWDGWWLTTAAEAPNFMLQNFGPWLLLPLAVGIAIWRAKNRRWAAEFSIYLGLFLIFFNVMVAPWGWDNVKILIFPYLGFARLAWLSLDSRVPGFSKYIIAFILFFAGFLAVEVTLAPPSKRGAEVYSTRALANLEGALREIPKDAVIAAATNHNHTLTYFGRVRAVGYEGHLWSHGIDHAQRLALLKKLMQADPATDYTQIAHALGATHILWGPEEQTAFQTEPPWPSTFKNVSGEPSIHILEVPK